MSPTSKDIPSTDESLQTLPSGHPQAGYVSPDLSFKDSAGKLPPEDQEWYDEQEAARDAEAKAVALHEDSVAKAEAEEPDDKTATKSGPVNSGSTSSGG